MYGMTAAHKTLPLPAYVRVTNLQNGRSVVVRVNDRGPFVGNRIIDLSYTAAAKLDMLRNGTAMVEVRTIDPTIPAGTPAPRRPQRCRWRTAAATPRRAPSPSLRLPPRRPATRAAPAARRLRHAAVRAGRRLRGPRECGAAGRRVARRRFGKVFVRDDLIAGRKMYRVRIGPVPDVPEFDRIVAALEQAGVQRCASRARLASRPARLLCSANHR